MPPKAISALHFMSKYAPDRMYRNKVYMAEWKRLSQQFYRELMMREPDANEGMGLPETREVRELHGPKVSKD